MDWFYYSIDVVTSFKGYIYYVILHLSKFSHKAELRFVWQTSLRNSHLFTHFFLLLEKECCELFIFDGENNIKMRFIVPLLFSKLYPTFYDTTVFNWLAVSFGGITKHKSLSSSFRKLNWNIGPWKKKEDVICFNKFKHNVLFIQFLA